MNTSIKESTSKCAFYCPDYIQKLCDGVKMHHFCFHFRQPVWEMGKVLQRERQFSLVAIRLVFEVGKCHYSFQFLLENVHVAKRLRKENELSLHQGI